MKTLILFLAWVVAVGGAAGVCGAGEGAGGLPRMEPLGARWTFSRDQGATYALESGSPGRTQVWGRAEFAVADPAAIGRMWFRPRPEGAGVTPVNSYNVGGRYIVMPLVLEEAQLTLNGQALEPEFPGSPTLYERWGIDPQLLRKGTNVLAFTGRTLPGAGRDPAPAEFALETTAGDALDLRNGPALGPIGADYFTLACRTWIPCEVAVKVQPIDPAGEEKEYAFPRGTLHHCRMPLPPGTRRFRYSVVARNGAASRAGQPYEVRVPDPARGMTFIVLGQTAANAGTAGLELAARRILELDPDFIIHTGSLLIYAYWDMTWDSLFFAPLKELLARKPLCAVPSYKDCYSLQFAYALYYPTENGLWANWNWAVGPVRFIGLEGMGAAAEGSNVAKWFEEQLQAAREDFVFEVTSYPAYTTNPFGRAESGKEYDRRVLHPLLAKYKATASLGCTGKYEFIPAPDTNSVPSVITGGVGAPMAPGWNKCQFCVFSLRDGKLSMKVLAYETGEVLDERVFAPRAP